MNFKFIGAQSHQSIPKRIICILIAILYLLIAVENVSASSPSTNEPSASPLTFTEVNKKTLPSPASINSKNVSTSQSVSHIFEHHCSPWIEEKIWKRIYPRLQLNCGSLEPSSTATGCGWRGKRKIKDDLSLTDSSKMERSRMTAASSRDYQSDSVIADKPKKPNIFKNNDNEPPSMRPPPSLPRRMSENFSPKVCSYTGEKTVNNSLDWMQDYLHEIRNLDNTECLLFDNSTIDSICSSKPNQGIEKIKSLNFGHCDRYPLINVLSDDAWAKVISPQSGRSLCADVLKELYLLDSFAKQIYCQFEQLLFRYKCESYSIKGTCSDCKKAYKDWVCSMVLPFYFHGIYLKPCRSFCEKVEQKCPHFHPATTYAGEPVFICIDPRIPYSLNSSKIPYGSPNECYESCHLADENNFYSDKMDKTCSSFESLIASVLKKKVEEKGSDNVDDHRSSSSSEPSSTQSSFLSTSPPAFTPPSSLVRKSRDRLPETMNIAVTDSKSNSDSVGLHKMMNGVDGPGLNDQSSQHIPSMALPLDDDGSEDEGVIDDDSISTTSSVSSTLPTVSSSSTHYSVQSPSPVPT